MASLTLLSELMNYDFSGLDLDDPDHRRAHRVVVGHPGPGAEPPPALRWRHDDARRPGRPPGHPAAGPPLRRHRPPTVADQMEEWFDTGACDGFVLAATHCPGAYEDVVRLVVPELQRRGVFRERYTGDDPARPPRPERPAVDARLSPRRPWRQRCTNPEPDDRSWRRRPAASGCARRRPSSGADLVFLDLEDACAPIAKEGARAIAVAALTEQDWGRTVRAVRVNGLDTPWCHDDIIEVVTRRPGVARRAHRAQGPHRPRRVVGRRAAHPARGASSASTKRDRARGADRGGRRAAQRGRDRAGPATALEAIIFGAGDLSASLQARVDGNFDPRRRLPRRLLALRPRPGARRGPGRRDRRHRRAVPRLPGPRRATGARPPTPASSASTASGPSTPARSPSPTRCSSPTAAEVADAREAIAAYRSSEADGVGAIGRDGRLVDAAHMRLAENTLHKASLAGDDPS